MNPLKEEMLAINHKRRENRWHESIEGERVKKKRE